MPSVIHRKRIIYPGSGGFLPNQISNLGFWLESDYGITRDGSNAVSEWVARGSRGYTLSQATGANQPIFTANEFGTQAGLIFDGSNDSLERSVSNAFGDVQTFSCFMVYKSQNNNNLENYFMIGDLGSNNFWGVFKGALIHNNSSGIQSVNGAVNDFIYCANAINDNIQRLLTFEGDGADWFIRINRINEVITVQAGTNSGSAPGDFSILDNITLAVLRRSTVDFVRSNFAAVLFYERQLSTAERTRVENYLISKYGIAA